MTANKEAERTAWLAERRTGIGGSDAAAVLGLSPWRTAVDVWLDKTGRRADEPETEAMRIGTELEDYVARRYCEATGRTVQRFNRMLHRGCLLGNLDRLVVAEGQKVASHMGEIRTDLLLECKTSSQTAWPDGVPLYYQTQVQHYMGLDERLRHADVAVLFLTAKHFETFRVERDDAVIAEMAQRLTAWWDRHVVHGAMPAPQSEEDCKALWRRSNPGKTVEATDGIVEAVGLYKTAAGTIKAAKAAQDTAKDAICAAMGDAEILADGATGKPLVMWRSAKDTTTTDWRALALSLGATADQIASYTDTKPGTRRFLVK